MNSLQKPEKLHNKFESNNTKQANNFKKINERPATFRNSHKLTIYSTKQNVDRLYY